ncbi:hypothetical protein CRE_05871 [Caenorhabditis remanei]|uniref:SCP domain-containing protein n=1 Tax=Caenorhabditis remanei TaxID=31234 RepID=E3MNI2_CAERE|nr:hypothetical protein CRE_05871 [Caenorhabditis remanei]
MFGVHLKYHLLFLFSVLSLTVEATKGGLSKDEQKKLLDEINKDRRDASGGTFREMTYDTELEKKAAELDCIRDDIVPLQWNSVAQDYWDETRRGHNPNLPLFDSRVEKIGCSKEIKCTEKIEKDEKSPEKFVGKEIVILGRCFISPNVNPNKIDKKLIPKGKKYGDVLGLKLSSDVKNMDAIEGVTSGTGNVFNFIILLAFPLLCL